MVHLQRLHETYEERGLFVFAISMHGDRGEARRWDKDLGVTYTVFDGHDSALGERYAYG